MYSSALSRSFSLVCRCLGGEALERFGGIVTRRDDPKRFWTEVLIYVLGGLLAISWHFYRIELKGSTPSRLLTPDRRSLSRAIASANR
jgi:hypothetical protein